MNNIKKRRGRGEGSIHQRPNGLWVGRISFGTGRRRKALYARTKSELMDKIQRARSEAALGLIQDARNFTLGSFLGEWLEGHVRPNHSRSTYLLYKGLFGKHVQPVLGNVALVKLNELHIKGLLADMERAGRSPRLRQIVRTIIHAALERAVEWKILSRNACDGVRKPKAPRRQFQTLTAEQVKRFLTAAKNDWLYSLYVLAFNTGMRQGEMFALQWDDVNLQARNLSVRHTLTKDDNGRLTRKDTKTGRGRRIELSDMVVSALREQRNRLFAEGLISSPWLFPDRKGEPLVKECVVRQSFLRMLKAAGLPRIRFHDIRHTAATLLLAQNVNPKVVQEMLGHSSISVTLDIYGHCTPTMQRGAADTLGEVLSA